MVKVVCLGTGKERQVVAGVGIQRGQDGQGEPQPRGGHMAAHQKDAEEGRQKVAEDVLNGMAIDGRHRDGGRPFVMLLVYILVDVFVVQQAV